MKVKDIIALLKSGKQPVVKITGELWDDAWGEVNMIATITHFQDKAGLVNEVMYSLTFDYNEMKSHNLSLQSHNYYLKNGGMGTAIEAGRMNEGNLTEDVYYMGEDEVNVVMLNENDLALEYLKTDKKLTYIQWLENEVVGARSLCERVIEDENI